MVDANAVKILSKLLQHAMVSAVVRDIHQGLQISTGEYLSLMASHRQSYDPDKRLFVRRFQPAIRDNALRESLRDVIRDALGQYIHNDMLQSAQIVTGGVLSGFHIDDLLEHLLTIAFVRGPRYAADNFYECVEKSAVAIQFITMIDGVKIESPIEISEGISLVPIPNDTKDFPPYIVTPHFVHYTDYYGRTLIIVDQLVSPVFAHPEEMSTTDFSIPFNRSNVNNEYPNFVEEEFCEALSLTTKHLVNYVSWWSYIDPDEAYAVDSMHSSAADIPSRVHRSGIPPIEVNEEDVRKAMSLYVTRKNLSSDVTRRLRVPIDRWMRSKTDPNPVDVFINLGTALESLFLGDIRYKGELRFRLALHAAWHLGSDAQERISLKREFARIYDLRSAAVHRGTLKDTDVSPEFTARAQKLCLKSITKIIQAGKFPDWNQLVMGSGSTT